MELMSTHADQKIIASLNFIAAKIGSFTTTNPLKCLEDFHHDIFSAKSGKKSVEKEYI